MDAYEVNPFDSETFDRNFDGEMGNGHNGNGHALSNINMGQSERWLSLAGGALLVGGGLMSRGLMRVVLSALGGTLLYNGISGNNMLYRWTGMNKAVQTNPEAVSVPQQQGIHVRKSVTINRPAQEIYTFWRDFTNLPRFMEHLESVDVIDGTRSHWKAKAPAGTTVEWDAEIVNDVPNEVIAWRSLPEAQVANAGSVRFKDAPGNRGTEVKVELEYVPPAGVLGAAVAKLFGKAPDQEIGQELRRLKQLLEAGEVPTTEGQSRGQKM